MSCTVLKPFLNITVWRAVIYSLGNFVSEVLSKRFNFRNREKFTEFLRVSGNLDSPKKYLDTLISWLTSRISVWQYAVVDSVLKSNYSKSINSNTMSKRKNSIESEGCSDSDFVAED